MLISPISIFSAQSLESVHRSSKYVHEFIGASMRIQYFKRKKDKSKFLKQNSTFDVQLHQLSSGHFYYLTLSHEPFKQPKFKGLPKNATTFILSTATPLLSLSTCLPFSSRYFHNRRLSLSTCLPFSSRYFHSRRLYSYVDFTNLNIFRSISRKCS